MRTGRPQISLAVAQAKGAIVHNPERFEGRIDTQANLELVPIGPISPDLADDPRLVVVWSSIVREVKWLRESDRQLVEVCCLLREDLLSSVPRVRDPVEFTVKGKMVPRLNFEAINMLLRVLSCMGATPTTVGKVFTGAKTDGDEKPKRGAKYQRYWNGDEAAAA